MSKINDGGPAFPSNEKAADGGHWHSHLGMSLRDAVALHFLAGAATDTSALDVYVAADQYDTDAALKAHWSTVARTAFIAANAFIAARLSQEGE